MKTLNETMQDNLAVSVRQRQSLTRKKFSRVNLKHFDSPTPDAIDILPTFEVTLVLPSFKWIFQIDFTSKRKLEQVILETYEQEIDGGYLKDFSVSNCNNKDYGKFKSQLPSLNYTLETRDPKPETVRPTDPCDIEALSDSTDNGTDVYLDCNGQPIAIVNPSKGTVKCSPSQPAHKIDLKQPGNSEIRFALWNRNAQQNCAKTFHIGIAAS